MVYEGTNSYGCFIALDRRFTDNGYFCNQYGYIAYDDYGVQYSYGHLARWSIPKFYKLLVVKIAVHDYFQRCICCKIGW